MPEQAFIKTPADCVLAHVSAEASDAKGTDLDGSLGGPANPQCPDGYLWGGLACVPVRSPQTCSTGYTWSGSACVPA